MVGVLPGLVRPHDKAVSPLRICEGTVVVDSNLYTSADVRGVFGITEKQVRYLGDVGAVAPFCAVNGTGNHREYDLRGMIEFALAVELRKLGTRHESVAACLRDLRTRWPGWYFADDCCVGFQIDGPESRVFFMEQLSVAVNRFRDWAKNQTDTTAPVFVNIGSLRRYVRERLAR